MDTINKQLHIDDLLRVHLSSFEGPLDLLLDLIRKKKVDIKDVSLVEICEPYLRYIDLMEAFDLDIAVEFFDIASTLVLIKSRTLLPREEEMGDGEDELDTEEMLKQKLIEYQKFKSLAVTLDERELLGRDIFCRSEEREKEEKNVEFELQDLSVFNLLMSYKNVMLRETYKKPHKISKDEFPIERKIIEFIKKLNPEENYFFHALVSREDSLSEIVISFMAILEMAKLKALKIVQLTEFGPIHCKPIAGASQYLSLFEEKVQKIS